MRIWATIKIALRALRRNKLRTALTMLGIVIGVGAVIAMVGIGNGAKAQVEARIAALGQNVIQIFSGSINRGGVFTGFGGAGTLTVADALAIQSEVPGVAAVSPEVRSGAQLTAGENNWSSQIMGESTDYLIIRQWDIADGTMFTEADVRSAAKVCVLGQTTADRLFPNEDTAGKTIRAKNVPLKVLGVLKRKGASMFGQDQDDTVIVPYTTAMKRFAGVTTLRSITVSASSTDEMLNAQNGITELLRQRHRIQPGRDDDFIIRNQQEISEAASATTETMTALLAGVAVISLIVGGIGIMNIMLVSVTERTREIGIRMAVGARGRDILSQFLIEAVTLSSIGGAIGIALGVSAPKIVKLLAIVCYKTGIPSDFISSAAGWPTLVSAQSIVVAFAFSAAVGIFFGFYPARKASQLDPIDALRYE
ncbi:MAG TPA: ABC transporter permease [Verrucomicrobiae bacterium]|nr:ABC transporter permease [Verrucomicrobiae bacterium]